MVLLGVSQKQLNGLAKGRPVQIAYSDLTSVSPNTRIHSLGGAMLGKVRRAIREKRGVRFQLSPEEIDSIETSLNGGKLNIGKAFRDLGHKIEKGAKKTFTKKLGNDVVSGLKQVGKVVARPAIHGLATAGIAGLTTLAGNPELTPFLAPLANKGIDVALDKAKLGFGVGKGVLSKIKKQMREHLTPHMESAKHAMQTTNKIFKDGIHILEHPSGLLKVSGGKINLKKIGKSIVKGAKEIFHRAKPVLKYAGEQAIKYAKPLAVEGLKELGASYGIDPALTEFGANLAVDSGEKLAKRGLDKYVSKDPSMRPEDFARSELARAETYGRKQLENVAQSGHSAISTYVPEPFQASAREILNQQVADANVAMTQGSAKVASKIRKRGHKIGEVEGGSFRGYGISGGSFGGYGTCGGSFGGYGGAYGGAYGGYGAGLLAAHVGQKKAREIWFMTREYNAQEALDMGLVNTVVPLAELEAETVSWCREMLRNSPMALRLLKASLNAATDGLAGVQQLAGDATLLFYLTEEGQEGRDAYQQKRKPDFGKFPKRP
jgi:hypothetical protein